MRPTLVIPAAVLLVLGGLAASCGPGSSSPADEGGTPPSAAVEVRVAEAVAAAGTWLEQGEAARAEAILAAAIRDVPDDPRVLELLGRVLLVRAAEADEAGRAADAASRRSAAADRYAAAVAGTPREDADLLHAAGIALLAAGRTEEAVACFDRAAAIRPAAAVHPLYAAQGLLAAGRLDEAEARLVRALELSGDEPIALASMAIVHLERDRPGAAIDAIEEARALDPENPGLRAQHARILRRIGRPRDGLALLLAVPEPERVRAGLTAEAAACRRAAGDPAGAARLWEGHHEELVRIGRAGAERFGAAAAAAEAWLEAGRPDRAAGWVDRARAAAIDPGELDRVEALAVRVRGD